MVNSRLGRDVVIAALFGCGRIWFRHCATGCFWLRDDARYAISTLVQLELQHKTQNYANVSGKTRVHRNLFEYIAQEVREYSGISWDFRLSIEEAVGRVEML